MFERRSAESKYQGARYVARRILVSLTDCNHHQVLIARMLQQPRRIHQHAFARTVAAARRRFETCAQQENSRDNESQVTCQQITPPNNCFSLP